MFLSKITSFTLLIILSLSLSVIAYAAPAPVPQHLIDQIDEAREAENAAPDPAADVQPSPGEKNLESLEGTGVRINPAFKPINAPDAITRSYGTDTVNAFLQFITGSIIEITGGIAVFVLVIAGYMYATSGGDQGRVDKAKEIVKYTIFGMLLVILSFVIVKTIISLILEVDVF